jgi:hypothetical protein
MTSSPIKYTNRRGKTYYLYQGTTKTGKAKYFFSTKIDENQVNSIPDDFEIYENPNARVFLIKKVTSLISDLEKQAVISSIKKNESIGYYIVDVKKEYITIHTAKQNPIFEDESWVSKLIQMNDLKLREISLNYMPEMRFKLVDANGRYFMAERFCYRGSIDDWIVISEPEKLNNLMKYIGHLGKDSFYELCLW